MSETLYRKHRPQRFADMVGQTHVRTTIQNQLRGGSVGHAYLFTGPRGVGKTTSARLLAKAMNCLNRGDGDEPCDTCDACLEIVEGRSLDVVEMDAASHTGVDNVRENIIENVRFAPTLRKYKIFIIDEVHMLSTSAFNALLKTLEEPPSHALFILATTEIHKVPQTIISRCQRFDFRRIPLGELTGRLANLAKAEGVTIDQTVLEEIARHSDGSQRDAESLLAQVLALGEKEITMDVASLVLPISPHNDMTELLEMLSRREAKQALEKIDVLVEQGTDMHHFLEDLIRYVRQLLLAHLGDAQTLLQDLPESVREKSVALSSAFNIDDFTRLMDVLFEARSGRMTIIQLPLEMALVKFCGAQTAPPPPSEPPRPSSFQEKREEKETGDTSVSSNPESGVGHPRTKFPTAPSLPAGRGSENLSEVAESPGGNSETTPSTVKGVEGGPELAPVSKEELKEVMMNAEVALPEKTGDHVTFKTVQGKWEEVFEKVSKAHTSMGFLLKSSKLIGVEGDQVRLGFDFKFHADTMNAQKNRRKLEDILQKVLGSRMRVLGEYVHSDADEIVGDLMGEFGGKVVE